MRNRILFCIAILCVTLQTWAQKSSIFTGVDISKTYPSPDVASLGAFGLIPANPFNGQANVSIPLYTVSYKDLEVPISLSYSTGGLRPDDHPGWTGLGWTLQSGGMIFRKVNGIYDEYPPGYSATGQFSGGYNLGYYENCGRIPGTFYNQDTIRHYAFDNSNEVLRYGFDGIPDEFIFNFNGYSGVFYITRPSIHAPVEIKIKPNGAYKLKAEIVEIKDYIEFDDWIETESNAFRTRITSRSIFKLKITDDKGIQYIFGGNPNAIEFSNNGNFTSDPYSIASAWHLTEIVSPVGYKIQFTYKKKGRVISQHKQRNATFYHIDYDFTAHSYILFQSGSGSFSYSGSLDNTSFMIQNPAWLDSIKTPLQTVTFTSSRSNELDYPLDLEKLHPILEPMYRFGADQRYWQKLDEINITGLKTIRFHYRHQADKRLRLDSLELRTPAQHKIMGYGFRYNDLLLPPYNSRQSDHWGYFNNRSYAYGGDYLTLREPNEQYLQAEMLKQINYPTGGYLKLEYEPHYYRKVCKQFPFTVEAQTANKLAGGLRIKKMISTANANDTPLVKEYFYTTGYVTGGTASSGVLSGSPQYTNTGSSRDTYRWGNFWSGAWGGTRLRYGKIIDNNFLQLGNTNGSHVTYSEVTERSGYGFTVYKYSNHDNGYLDKAPYTMYSNFTSQWHEEGFTSMAPFRGQLLNTTWFDETKRRLKSISYNYFIDTSTAYKIPTLHRTAEDFGGYSITRVSTCVFFIKPVLPRSVVETDYVAGTTDSINVHTGYRYYPDDYPAAAPSNDHYQQTEVSRFSSKSETISKVFRYPLEMVMTSADPTGVYQEMIGKNIVSPVIETISLKGNVQTELTRTNYYKPGTGIYKMKSIEVKPFNEAVETRFQVHQYDAKGNIAEQSKANDVSETIIWGYKWQYPVAKIVGSSYTNAIRFVNQTILENAQAYTEAQIRTELNKLRTNLPNAFVTTFTWLPLKGMTSETDPQGRTTYYEYDPAGRLKLIRDQDRNVIKKFCYNYAGQPATCDGIVYNSKALSQAFTRNNCAVCEEASTVTYTVPAAKYYSEINQADADAQAMADMNANGQNYANQNGTCYKQPIYAKAELVNINAGPINTTADLVFRFYSDINMTVPYSVTNMTLKYRTVTRYCGSNPATVTTDYAFVCSGTDTSFQVQTATDVGDGIHCWNANFELLPGDCYFYKVYANSQQSQTFTRNNCPAGYTGTPVIYTVPGGKYRSIISQADADAQATAEINANGQNYANTNGSCVFYNVAMSQNFTRNNCPAPQYGSTVTYTVPAGKHSSTVSQADANAKAQNDLNTNGQQYANANGTCTMPGYPHVKMTLTNYADEGAYGTADLVFQFYSNPERTVPMSVSNLKVNYEETTNMCEGGSSVAPLTVTCNGTSTTLRVETRFDIGDGMHCWWKSFLLLAGTGYYK